MLKRKNQFVFCNLYAKNLVSLRLFYSFFSCILGGGIFIAKNTNFALKF
ncbi:MAG: hypothetical protein RL757_2442 [Bacteroidota bacterium]|jgi:hypothetical protein